MKSKQKSI